MILFFFFRNCSKITDEVSQNRCCKQMNPVGLHVTTQNYNRCLISRYKRNQSRKTKQYHYQFPKVNQTFCYIKHCNHLFCPDFAKAIKYGCELKLQNKINLSSIDQYPMLSHTTKVLHWNRPLQPVSGNSVHNWSIYWSVV